MAGFAIGACALAVPRAGVMVTVGLGAMAAAGAVVFDGSVVENLGFALGSAAVVWLTGLVLVWLLGLVGAAEAGRQAEADLVLAQERLRVSRELHDVLGHRLGIIALKAELAADLAASDPAGSAAESGEIREIAAATLAEARQQCTAKRSPTWPPRSHQQSWSSAPQASRPRSTSTLRKCQRQPRACWLPWSAKQ